MTDKIHKPERLRKWLLSYLIVCGVAANLMFASLYLFTDWLWVVKQRVIAKFGLEPMIAAIWPAAATHDQPVGIAELRKEIADNFGSWTPQTGGSLPAQTLAIGTATFTSLDAAVKALQSGNVLEIGPGVYRTPLVIVPDQVTVVGRGRVTFDGPNAEGKAAIVIKGNNTRIVNIECMNIRVPSENGACVRMEGRNLDLEHVYFHDSEEGLLTTDQPGILNIRDSRFELLGMNGFAHGVYTGGGELNVTDSLFLASVSQGHEIKSRSAVTRIAHCVLASLDAQDSRLLDLPNGGLVTIQDSVLEKGPASVNGTAIGYGLEAMNFDNNYLILKNNVIIMERAGMNRLVQIKEHSIAPVIVKNLIVSDEDTDYGDANRQFGSRRKAGLAPYPFVPAADAAAGMLAGQFQ